MAGTVVVEVVLKLVGDGVELVEQVVRVLLASRFARVGVEVLNGLHALVEQLDEEFDALRGIVCGVAELLDLGLGERVVVLRERGV